MEQNIYNSKLVYGSRDFKNRFAKAACIDDLFFGLGENVGDRYSLYIQGVLDKQAPYYCPIYGGYYMSKQNPTHIGVDTNYCTSYLGSVILNTYGYLYKGNNSNPKKNYLGKAINEPYLWTWGVNNSIYTETFSTYIPYDEPLIQHGVNNSSYVGYAWYTMLWADTFPRYSQLKVNELNQVYTQLPQLMITKIVLYRAYYNHGYDSATAVEKEVITYSPTLKIILPSDTVQIYPFTTGGVAYSEGLTRPILLEAMEGQRTVFGYNISSNPLSYGFYTTH